jgi:hypothetical protein
VGAGGEVTGVGAATTTAAVVAAATPAIRYDRTETFMVGFLC